MSRTQHTALNRVHNHGAISRLKNSDAIREYRSAMKEQTEQVLVCKYILLSLAMIENAFYYEENPVIADTRASNAQFLYEHPDFYC